MKINSSNQSGIIGIGRVEEDEDMKFARKGYEGIVKALRNVKKEGWGEEEVVWMGMLGTSWQVFAGGIEGGWRETAGVCGRCLGVLLGWEEGIR